MFKKSRGLERNLAFRKLGILNCIFKEGLNFGPFQNLEATSDSLSSLEGAFEVLHPKTTEKYTNEIGSIFHN